ncbi:MAG: heat-inducible transcription repressor HrcA [Bacilli bacterium]|nr:heat-inducible transcription repressor HrcA [Bacilli bacterium]
MSLSRSDTILKYIVEYFIKHAEPVGSKTLIEEYHLNYSSATVRNEMFALEKMGYIEKPHQSAGRVPSSKGYKYYCEYLRDKGVDEEIKNSIQLILNKKSQSVEETIKASCEILSHMTSLVSVFLGPDGKEERLANVQLIQVSEKTLTAIFVTDSGYVENKTFIVSESIKPNDLVECVKILNDRLVGTPITELVEKMEALKPILNDYIINNDALYQAIIQTFLRFASDRLSLYGRDELFNQPEFKNDVEKLQNVLKLLTDPKAIKGIGGGDEIGDVEISIGDIENNPDVSVMTAKVKIGDADNGSTIALIGPRRMDYDKAMSALEYLAKMLEQYFQGEGEDE